MHSVSPQRIAAVLVSMASAAAMAACSSPPSRLYMLSSMVTPPPQVASADPGVAIAAAAQSPSPRTARGLLFGVSVTVPEYLDRLDIVERTNGNELKPVYSAQWAESLAVTATRAFTEDLGASVPSGDFVMLPSRTYREMDYEINLDLTKFESDSAGLSVLSGRWSLRDRTGTERAGGQLRRSEQTKPGNYAEMAAAMSRNLAGASTDIASALLRIEPRLAGSGPAGR